VAAGARGSGGVGHRAAAAMVVAADGIG